MENAERIAVEKDAALSEALGRAAELNEPGTPQSELLRYLALVGAENLPEPFVEPTPEQIQRTIDVWMKLGHGDPAPPPSACGPFA
jgi:hypothetical protein